MKKDNKETMSQIDDDAKDEINKLREKNAGSVSQVKDMALMSTAELQNKRNKLQDVAFEIETGERQIKDREI